MTTVKGLRSVIGQEQYLLTYERPRNAETKETRLQVDPPGARQGSASGDGRH